MKEGTLKEMVLRVIRGTSNKSAAGIGYRLINLKLVLGTRLGAELVELIVDRL